MTGSITVFFALLNGNQLNNKRTLWTAVVLFMFLVYAFWLGVQQPDLIEKHNASRLPDNVIPQSYHIDLAVDPNRDRFGGHVDIAITLKHASMQILLHGREMTVGKVSVSLENGLAIRGHWKNRSASGLAQINFDVVIPEGNAVLHIDYDAPFNKQLQGLYSVEHQGRQFAFTQLESIDARRVFPGFDEPRFKTPFELVLTIPKELSAIANMPVVQQEAEGDNKRLHFAATDPLPTYLLAFAVGDFDIVEAAPLPINAIRTHEVPLRGIVAKGEGAQLQYALDHTAAIIDELERYFGIPYPFPKLDLIAVPDFSAGAMENPGAIMYRDTLLMIDEHSSQADKRDLISTHAHELAHQWFGNLVTMPWWNDIWLNEAFASWMGNKVAQTVYPEFGFDRDTQTATLDAMNADSRVNQREIRQPITKDEDADSAFDEITYDKGAGVLTMYERYIGEKQFQLGVRTYFARHAFDTANSEEFIRAIGESTGNAEVPTSFKSYLTQSGVPLVKMRADCKDERLLLHLSQEQYLPLGSVASSKRLWDVPVCVGIAGKSNSQQCMILHGDKVDWSVDSVCNSTFMPNAQGSGYYRWSLDDESRERLLQALPQLPLNEATDVAANLTAALKNGSLSLDKYLHTLKSIAANKDPLVSLQPLEDLYLLSNLQIPAEQRLPLQGYLGSVWREHLKGLHLKPLQDDEPDKALLREKLIRFAALTARDNIWRERLTHALHDYMGKDFASPVNNAALAPELLATALQVVIEDGDAITVKQLLKRTANEPDSQLRSEVIGAINFSTDGNAQDQVHALYFEPSLRTNERGIILQKLFSKPGNWGREWQWLHNRFNDIVPLLPEVWKADLPRALERLCDAQLVNEVQLFFIQVQMQLPGSALTRDSAAEKAAQCIALRNSFNGVPLGLTP